MARTVRDANLESRAARARLKARGKPYYRAIDSGLHVGYRKSDTGGRWVVRWYVGKQQYKMATLDGAADDVQDADGTVVLNFSQAQAKARELFVARKREAAGLPARSAGPYRVRDCIGEYIDWLEGNRKSAKDARYRAEALILPKLGDKPCDALSTHEIRRWLHELEKVAPRLRTKKGEKQRHAEHDDSADAVRRRRASANRVLTILKAALNHAWREQKIATDDAWRRVEPFEETNAPRVRYLKVDEAKRLINASGPDFRRLVQAALATGARYGELAALDVADFNTDSATLHIRKSKSGKDRHVVLAAEGVKFFQSLTAGRAPDEPMLQKSGGGRWLQSHQARPMAVACKAAKVKAAGFHVLRHTYASHALMNGAPLLVVAKNLGHADTRMVELHYAHLAPSYVADAIRAAAPKFGIKAAGNVVPMPRRKKA